MQIKEVVRMWYAYILQSRTDGRLYIGSTNDLKRRLEEHNAGKVAATEPRCPLFLKSYLAVESEEAARALEQYLKSGSGHAFIRKRLGV